MDRLVSSLVTLELSTACLVADEPLFRLQNQNRPGMNGKGGLFEGQ